MAYAGMETHDSMRHADRSRPRYMPQGHMKKGSKPILLSLNAND